MLALVSRTAAFRLRNREGYGNMMQRVQVQATTAGGYLQVGNVSAFVGGGKTCWKQPTVGCDYYTGLIGSMRMCRG